MIEMMVNGFWIGFVALIVALYFLAGCTGEPIKVEEKPAPVATISEAKPACGGKPLAHLDTLHRVLIRANPSSMTFVDLKTEMSEQFIAAFNSSPPTSNVDKDSIVRLYQRPDALNIFIAIATKKGCVVTAQEMPRPQVIMWMQGRPTPLLKQRSPEHAPKENPTKT